MFNEHKATELAAHFLDWAGGRMKYIQLLKLVYLADRAALDKEGHGVSTDHWVSMKHGPVPRETYTLITDEEDPSVPEIWSLQIKDLADKCVGLQGEVELRHLSQTDQAIAREVWDQYGHLPIWDKGGLIEYTHSLPEWEDPAPLGSTPIPLKRVLRALGKSAEEIQAILELEQSEAWLDDVLS